MYVHIQIYQHGIVNSNRFEKLRLLQNQREPTKFMADDTVDYYSFDVIWGEDLKANPAFQRSPWRERSDFALQLLRACVLHFLIVNGTADTFDKVADDEAFHLQMGYERRDGSFVPLPVALNIHSSEVIHMIQSVSPSYVRKDKNCNFISFRTNKRNNLAPISQMSTFNSFFDASRTTKETWETKEDVLS